VAVRNGTYCRGDLRGNFDSRISISAIKIGVLCVNSELERQEITEGWYWSHAIALLEPVFDFACRIRTSRNVRSSASKMCCGRDEILRWSSPGPEAVIYPRPPSISIKRTQERVSRGAMSLLEHLG
jgi:hypothetical protein